MPVAKKKKSAKTLKELWGKRGLNTNLKGLSLFWLIWEPNRIMTDLDYSSLKTCESKNIYIKEGKVFYRRMPNNKYGRKDGIHELISLLLPM